MNKNSSHRALKVALLITASLIFNLAWGQQEIVFKAKANKEKMAIGERLKVSYTINATGNQFDPPSFENFQVLGGPNRSTSVRIVNGQVSKKTIYSYILKPRQPGKYKIPPATIRVRGKELSSNKITVQVTQEKQTSSQTKKKQSSKKSNKKSLKEKIANNLFLRLKVSKTDVYRGEHLVADYKLYRRVDLMSLSLEKMPLLSGFWTQDITSPKKLNYQRKMYKGKPFQVATIRKMLLFPQRTGKLTIDPMEMKVVSRVRVKKKKGRGLFNMFFKNYKKVPLTLKSNEITINVKELPANPPSSFQGAVGRFSISSSVDKKQAKANNPVTYRLQLSGNGNLKLISPPEFDLSPDMERYDPKINDKVKVKSSGMQGNRTFEYLLIPRYEGSYKVPSVEFTYFNPYQEQYITDSTQSYKITVKGQGKQQMAGKGVRQKKVSQVEEDILFIKTVADFREKGKTFIRSPIFYGLMGSPLILFLGLLGYRWRERRILADEEAVRQRRARKLSQRRLKAARRYKNNEREEAFYEEIVRALWGYLGEKLNIPPSELSQEKVRKALTRKNMDKETIEWLLETVNQAEFARYATPEEVDKEEVYQNSVKIISRLEQTL